MNILITGGAGYIGSILTPLLLSQNHRVIVIDNYKYNQSSLTTSIINKNFTLIKEDCRNIKTIKEIIKQIDIVIPLAAYVGAPLCNKDPWSASSINKDSILDLFKILSKNQLVIMPTTNSAYGSGNNFGLDRTTTRYALILNPDVVCKKNYFENIEKYIDDKVSFSIIGSQYENNDEWAPCGYFNNDK